MCYKQIHPELCCWRCRDWQCSRRSWRVFHINFYRAVQQVLRVLERPCTTAPRWPSRHAKSLCIFRSNSPPARSDQNYPISPRICRQVKPTTNTTKICTLRLSPTCSYFATSLLNSLWLVRSTVTTQLVRRSLAWPRLRLAQGGGAHKARLALG